MLTSDYLLHCTEGAEHISSQLHAQLMRQIIARIQVRASQGKDYILTASDKWRIQTLQDAGYLLEDIQKDIARYSGYQEKEIQQAMLDAGVESMEYEDKLYKAAGLKPSPMSPYMERLMERNYRRTIGTWQNMTGTTATATQQTFINAMDELYTKVATGGMGYIQAYMEAIDKVANDGVLITYPTGHTDTIETATLRCVRTGISQSTAEISLERMEEMGVDLVLVSSHMGARPEHEAWQGQVYSLSGLDAKYDNFYLATDYGSVTGLCGANCRHSFGPYIEGMDNPYKRYDNEENKQLYEDTQKQRAMERSIRKDRRAEQALKFAVDNEKDPEAKALLKEEHAKKHERVKLKTEKYNEFCKEHDFRPLPERLRVAQTGRRRPEDNIKIDDRKPRTTSIP